MMAYDEPLAGEVVGPGPDFDDAPVIGFTIAPFNWRLRRAREAKGWSRTELAQRAGLSPTTVVRAEKLKHIGDDARWKMALALGVPEDVLFPGEIDALPQDGPGQIELSLTPEDIRSLEAPDPHQQMLEGSETRDLREAIDATLDTLPPRERRVLESRFGLDHGGRRRTLDEVAHQFGVTRERIRQLETKALRKLRHPTRAAPLLQFFDDAPLPPPTEMIDPSTLRFNQRPEPEPEPAPGARRLFFSEKPKKIPTPKRPPAPKPSPRPQPSTALPLLMWVERPPRTEAEMRAELDAERQAGWEALNAVRRRLGLPEVWG